MPRRAQPGFPSYFHVLNRSVRRARLFAKDEDYLAFIRALRHAQRCVPMPLHAYCVMPNHFHLIVGPALMPDLSAFMHRLTVVHSKRWHKYHATFGTGPVYQGRFKSRLIDDYEYFAHVIDYVQQNPVRAGLVSRPEDWPWSSIGARGRKCNDLDLQM